MSNSTSILNGSRYPPMIVPWYQNEYNVSMVILHALVITASIIGNVLICTAVVINNKLRKNVASYFIVSLAIADLCTACFSMPFDLETFITYGIWKHGKILCSVWGTVYLISVPISIWNLFVLSIDRYKTLKNPWDRFKASPFMTPRRALIVIATLWICCLAFAMIPLMGWSYKPPSSLEPYCSFNGSPNYALLTSFLNFFLPMFAMCFIYFKIYEIARTQYLMPTGLEAKSKSLPSQTEANHAPKERQSMSNEHRNNYESCNARTSRENVQGSGLANPGLEMENGNNANRTRTFIELIENTDNGISDQNQNDDGIEQNIEEGKNTVSVEDVALREKEGEQEEEKEKEENTENIPEKFTEDIAGKEDQSTKEVNLDHPKDSVDENINKVEENDNSSMRDVKENIHDPSSPRPEAVTSQEDTKNQDNEENLDFIKKNMLQDSNEVILKDETSGVEKDSVESPSMGEEHDQGEDESSNEMELKRQESDAPDQRDHLPSDAPNATVSLEMQTYLRKKVFSDADREKSSSRESLQSTCTVQSTLPDGRHSVLLRDHRDLSTSRDTLNSAFGSMDDLTKRKKKFVKNKKAARTISIIVSAFLLCWIPVNTLSVVLNICKNKCYSPLVFNISQVLVLLGYANSMLNPIIFSYQNVQFRISYRKIFKKIFPCLRK